ncbi:MAG: helix-turn-helix domain-containing protein [Pseudomonadota bacterium]
MIETWDFYIRLIAIGAALLLIAQMAAGDIRDRIKFPVVFMVIGAIAYLMNSTPVLPSSGPMDPWIDLLSLSVPFWIWMFARNLFEREARPRVILIVAALFVGAWSISNFFAPAGLIGFYIIHLISLGLIGDLVRVAFLDREDDLVEERRIIRLWLPLLVAAQAGTILAAELIFVPNAPPPAMQLLNAVMILALILFAGLSLLRAEPALLMETNASKAANGEEGKLDLSPSEAVLHEKLKHAMDEGGYRTTGLTIAALADQLDTPEHRLRALINQRLGYRNFSAFLNRHRIGEAREKLVDKQNVDLPVLTIAMDLGYNSLATFNRAFRSETGTTPSDYRRLGMADEPVPAADQN